MADRTPTINPDSDPETSLPHEASSSQLKTFPQEQQQQQQQQHDDNSEMYASNMSNALDHPDGYDSSEASNDDEPPNDFSVNSMDVDQPPPLPRHNNRLVHGYSLCTPACRKLSLLVVVAALFGGAMLGVGYAIGHNATTTQSIQEEAAVGGEDESLVPFDGRSGADDDDYDATPAAPPPTRYSIVRDIIEPISGTRALNDPLSPQSQSLTWVVYHDSMAVDPSRDLYTLIQRYALATFFFATEGSSWFTKTKWLGGEDMCRWYGVTCEVSESTGESYVTTLMLSKNNVGGEMPIELGELIELTEVELWENDIEGTIPEEIGRLKKLTRLYLDDNKMGGYIPPSLGNLAELEQLALFGNDLRGPIPTELGRLGKLKRLWANDMGLTGTIPTEIGDMASLAFLYLEGNELSGSIPDEIGRLSLLEDVRLERNALRGSLPVGMRQLINLTDLYLNENELNGSLPGWIGDLTKLEYVYLSDNSFDGQIPGALSNLVNLKTLTLDGNDFEGTVPNGLCTLSLSTLTADCSYDDPKVQCDCCVCK